MRVFIACGDTEFRSAMLQLVESEPGMVVTGMAGRSDSLLTILRAAQPEVLLLDYELTKEATAPLVRDLHDLKDQPKVVVLAIDPQVKAATLAAGADAFISKDVPADELLPILRRMRASDTRQ